jgi:FAD/FMN-containing dehydrogenase
VTADHVRDLRVLVDSGSLLSTLDGSASPDDLVAFNNDWMNKYHGKSQVVIKPRTTEEVAAVVRYCSENTIAVVPQGGNTGLVGESPWCVLLLTTGGGVPIHDEVVLSLAHLNKVRSFNTVSNVLVSDAGVILEAADNYLAERGFIFPLDLGAKGSCHIGGNVATNAGGLRLLRYGSLHGSVLGLEVVLSDGTIWNGLRELRKDNTGASELALASPSWDPLTPGLDLKQLFIGSEGTLGVITAVSILCPRRPAAMRVAVFSVASFEDAQRVYADAKSHLGEVLSAFEFWDKHSYAYVRQHHGDRKLFETEGDFYCLVEMGGSNAEHDAEVSTGTRKR